MQAKRRGRGGEPDLELEAGVLTAARRALPVDRGTMTTMSLAVTRAVRAVLLAVTLAPLTACGEDRPQPPNLVLVVADTLRADYLGFYGFDGDVSPVLDRLAAESIVFENCFSQAPWTKPSAASLLTSLYPGTHGLVDHGGESGDDSAERRTSVLPESMSSTNVRTSSVPPPRRLPAMSRTPPGSEISRTVYWSCTVSAFSVSVTVCVPLPVTV